MGMKLGTLLVREGVISAQQLEEALRLQVLYGGRIGTNLVEIHALDPETLGTWLSRASGFPVATDALLREAHEEAIQTIPADVAERFECFPLRKEGRKLLIAMVNPVDLAAVDALSFKTGLRLVPYIVPEFVLYTHLEKRYGVVQKLRYVRLSQRMQEGPVVPAGIAREALPTPSLPQGVPALSTVPPTASRPSIAPTPPPMRTEPTPRPSVSGIPSIAPAPGAGWTSSPGLARARESTPPPPVVAPAPWVPTVPPPVAPVVAPAPPAKSPLDIDVERVIQALQSARSREEVAAALLGFAPDRHDTILLFVVRDEMALGWKGRGLGIDDKLVDCVMLPLNTPSIFQDAARRRLPVCGAVEELPLHKHFFRALGRNPPACALVVPVLVRDRAVNLIYLDRLVASDVTQLAEALVEVAKHVSIAYERILRESKRAAGMA